ARDGIVDGARHAAQRGFMQDVVHALAGLPARVERADVALDEAEALPLLGADRLTDLVEVVLEAGGEVVQADDFLAALEQRLDEVRSDEPRATGDEPRMLFVHVFSFVYLTAAGSGPVCRIDAMKLVSERRCPVRKSASG